METAESLRPPPIPVRSRLYSLPPIGVGTAEVESLTSYTTRLALAHGVSAGVLMTREIARLMRPGEFEPGGYFKVTSQNHSVNGMDGCAANWISALERLTLRRDLSMLTLRSWQYVLPRIGVMRTTKAWCPHCYEQDSEPYERLLWSLRAVTVCPKHQISLTRKCPQCSQELKVLRHTGRLSACSRCGASFSQPINDAVLQTVSADSIEHEISNSVQLGNLLAMAAVCEPPGRDRVPAVIAKLRHLCQLRGVRLFWEGRKASCGQRRTQPSLSSLLSICENAGVSLSDFMTTPLDNLEVSPKLSFHKAPARRLRRINAAVVGSRFRELVQSARVPPPSLRDVTVLLDVHVNSLLRFFPELCRIVVSRYRKFARSKARERRKRLRDEVWHVATKFADAGNTVTEACVAKALRKPGAMRDPVARQAYREFVAQRTT